VNHETPAGGLALQSLKNLSLLLRLQACSSALESWPLKLGARRADADEVSIWWSEFNPGLLL